MNSDGAARRYAEALFSLGTDSGNLPVFQQNAEDFLKVLESSHELRVALSHPNIRKIQRKAIIDAVLSNCGYVPMFANFVRLVVERGRIQCYPKIVAAFIGLRDEAAGRLRGVVYSATSLSSAQMARLKTKIESKIGHEVNLENQIDESLIGGIRVEVDGRVFDGSVKCHLEKMRTSMLDLGIKS